MSAFSAGSASALELSVRAWAPVFPLTRSAVPEYVYDSSEDHMAELHVLAVDPHRQRQGVGSALMGRVYDRARAAGMRMVMVETGGDPGHAPARAVYESAGFERWPVARYFKEVS